MPLYAFLGHIRNAVIDKPGILEKTLGAEIKTKRRRKKRYLCSNGLLVSNLPHKEES
jgi:hypothetical protein